MLDPLFPPELEEQIFVHAIRNCIEDALNLLLVVKRMREWYEDRLDS